MGLGSSLGRRTSRPVLTTLAALLVGSVLPLSSPRAAESAAAVEVTELRTATSKTLQQPDGTLTTSLFSAPVHYLGSDGAWQPISSKLVPDSTAGYAWRNEANTFAAHFKGTPAEGFVRLDVAGQAFTLSLDAVGSPGGVVDGAEVTYAGAFPGVDLQYEVLPAGVKETVVLRNAAAPTSYRFTLSPPQGLPLEAQYRPDGSWEFITPTSDGPLFVLGAPWAAESGPDGRPVPDARPHASVEVTPSGGAFSIILKVNQDWLAEPGRSFPVFLDPTLTIGPPNQNASFDAACPTCQGLVDSRLNIGGSGSSQWRSALKFNLSDIPRGAGITQAQLRLFYDRVCLGGASNCGGVDHQMQAFRMTGDWTTRSTSADLSFDPTAVSAFTLARGSDLRWMTWDVTSTVKDWVAGTYPNHGLMLKRNPETTGSSGPRPPSATYADDAGVRPQLEVTWSGDGVTLLQPTVLHSNGAELEWVRYAGTGAFSGYQIHRSTQRGFTPSPSTLIATVGDEAVTTYRDTTASPGTTFHYVVVAGGKESNQQRVTVPASGRTVAEVQLDSAFAEATYLAYSSRDALAACSNFGGAKSLRVGTTTAERWRPAVRFDVRHIPADAQVVSATLSMYYPGTMAQSLTVDLHRATQAWIEGGGPGGCDGSGATWKEAQAGVSWEAAEGGVFEATPSASVSKADRSLPGRDNFTITSLVQQWVSGTAPNHGVVLKSSTDATLEGSKNLEYLSDEYDVAPSLRPRLTVEYAESTGAEAPLVTMLAPGAGASVSGTVDLKAGASDDGRVAAVEFLVDGAKVSDGTKSGTAPGDPFVGTWNASGVAAGTSHSITARATDDAGNAATSPAVQVTVDARPSVTAPDAGGNTLSGTVQVRATPSDDLGVNRVEFFADAERIGTDTSSPYEVSWNTLQPGRETPDGSYDLVARAYDSGGQERVSTATTVTVRNAGGTKYLAEVSPTSPDSVPRTMAKLETYPVDVNIKNTGTEDWAAGTVKLWYRWFDAAGNLLPLHQGQTGVDVGAVPKNGPPVTKQISVVAPRLDDWALSGAYTLRFDLREETTPPVWFASKGNKPSDHPILVNKELMQSKAFGLEHYYHYLRQEAGAGMTHLFNPANGNSILRWTPFSSPGRGLSTVLSLTYNSLEDDRYSPAGNSWSLSLSGLVRFGTPLDIHPNKADQIQGRTQSRWIALTDGDGTTHVFRGRLTGPETGQPADDASVYWVEPDGVHLYLREYEDAPTSDRKWAITRPDRVTFFFDEKGFPTYVRDRNDNEFKFVYQNLPSSADDPGGANKRIVEVKEMGTGGRAFLLDYYTKQETTDPQIRGRIQSITDHGGHTLEFHYYEDGNLLRLTQRGTGFDGSVSSRSFVFTYTTSSGSCTTPEPESGGCPAIDNAEARKNPDPGTAPQSSRLFSVLDPRQSETRFDYYIPPEGDPKDHWKLQALLDREKDKTSYAYNITTRVTTVTAPLNRKTELSYDTTGRVTSIKDPANRVTGIEWYQSPDIRANHVQKVTEPGGGYTTFDYNANGYLTSQSVAIDDKDTSATTDDVVATTVLEYQNLQADGGDPTGLKDVNEKWKQNRTIPHLSQLVAKTDPEGVATTDKPADYRWVFTYDSVGNLLKVISPEPADKAESDRHATTYAWNLAGSANPGTLSSITDANGFVTRFEAYHRSGQPTRVVQAMDPTTTADDLVTELGYENDGQLQWIQDPLHAGMSGSEPQNFRTWFYYDGLLQLVRQSTPKSTKFASGVLIWSQTEFDKNGNLVTQFNPRYGSGFTGGKKVTASYDLMDRPLSVTNQENHQTGYVYDDAGRVIRVTRPEGTATTAQDKDYATFYDYDPLDRVVTQTRYELSGGQPVPLRSHYCYDLAGNLRAEIAPKAGLSSPPAACDQQTPYATVYAYDDAHRLLSEEDPLGHRRSFGYDLNDNPTTLTAPAPGGTETRVYDQRNLLVRTIEPHDGTRKVTTAYEYDGVGNLIRKISPRAWDTSSTKVFTDDSPFVTAFKYDGANRLVKVLLPMSASETQRTYVHHTYDPNGNLAWISLPTTHADPGQVTAELKTQNTYFDPGWIRTSKEGANPEVRFDYEPEGWQKSRLPTGNRGLQMIWAYYPDGRLQERKDRDGGVVTYTYDKNDNLTKTVDDSGAVSKDVGAVTIDATYDWLDRPSTVKSTHQGKSSLTTYTYDPNSNVSTRTEDDPAQPGDGRTQTFFYDEADWLTSQKDQGPDGDAGTSDDRRLVNLFWDTGWERKREIYRGAGDGTLKQTTLWDWFENGKLRTLTTKNASGAVMEDHSLSYVTDRIYINGHRTQDTFTQDGPGTDRCRVGDVCTAKWTYDARDRLTKHEDGHGGRTTYELDPAGNIKKETEVSDQGATTTREYTYQGNRVETVTVDTVLKERHYYDDLGRLWCVTKPAGTKAQCSQATGTSAPTDLMRAYSYDKLDRLKAVRVYSAGAVQESVTYVHDPLDRVVRQTEEWKTTGEKREISFSYLGLTNLVAREDITGHQAGTKDYTYDAYGHRIDMTDDPSGTAPAEHYTYGYDPHGSVSLLLKDPAQVTDGEHAKAAYGYKPYGLPDQTLTKGDTNEKAAINPYRYTGRRIDPISDTYDMGARRFGPDVSKFLQPDLFMNALADVSLSLDPLTQNRYALAGGNPVSYVEWDGHMVAADNTGNGSMNPAPLGVSGGGGGGGGGGSGTSPGTSFGGDYAATVSSTGTGGTPDDDFDFSELPASSVGFSDSEEEPPDDTEQVGACGLPWEKTQLSSPCTVLYNVEYHVGDGLRIQAPSTGPLMSSGSDGNQSKEAKSIKSTARDVVSRGWAFLRQYLSAAEQAAVAKAIQSGKPWKAFKYYGHAVHRAVADQFRPSEVIYNASKGADYSFVKSGKKVELTTPSQAAAHESRYPGVEVVTYDPFWPPFPGA